MAIDGRKLVNYLAHNISHSHIAEALGITASRVTQLSQDSRVEEAVAKKKADLAESGMTEIADLVSIKRTLINRMSDLAATTDSLNEAVNALEKIDKLTSKRAGENDSENGVGKVIMMAPVFLQQKTNIKIEKDSANRIVSIQDRNMAPMPTKEVLEILQESQK